MLRRATLLLCLLPGVALAQSTTAGTTTALVTTQSRVDLANRVDCASTTTTSTWTIASNITPVVTAGDKWRLAAVSQATGCSTNGGSTGAPTGFLDVLATGATQNVTGVLVASMASAGGVTNCASPADVTINLCVYYLPGGSTANWQLASSNINFKFELAIPPPPSVTRSSPGDGQLGVTVAAGTTSTDYQADSATTTYSISCTPAPGSIGSSGTGGPSNAGTIVCGGLTNSVAYVVTATGTSQAGNAGPSSTGYGPDATTTPLPFLNFWQIYKTQGGVEQGGCSTGGAGALWPAITLLGLLAVRRRRS
jgi:MYXO-CTERM domain-containing protein